MGRPKLCSCHCGEPEVPEPYNVRSDHAAQYANRWFHLNQNLVVGDVAIDSAGSVITVGSRGAIGTEFRDFDVVKRGANGSLHWKFYHQGSGYTFSDSVYSVAVDDDDNIYIGGQASSGGAIRKLSAGGEELVNTADEPAFSTGRIVVPGDGHLYAIESLGNGNIILRPNRLTKRSAETLEIVAQSRLNDLPNYNDFGFDFSAPGGAASFFRALAVDESGSVYVSVHLDSQLPPYYRQRLRMFGPPTGGHFRLTYDGETTIDLDHDASASEVSNALLALPSFNSGNLSVTGGPLPNGPITLNFRGDLADTDVLVTAADVDLEGDGAGVTVEPAVQTEHIIKASAGGGEAWRADTQIPPALAAVGLLSDLDARSELICYHTQARDHFQTSGGGLLARIDGGNVTWSTDTNFNTTNPASRNRMKIGTDGNIYFVGTLPDGPAGDVYRITPGGSFQAIGQYRQGFDPGTKPVAIVERDGRIATIGQRVDP